DLFAFGLGKGVERTYGNFRPRPVAIAGSVLAGFNYGLLVLFRKLVEAVAVHDKEELRDRRIHANGDALRYFSQSESGERGGVDHRTVDHAGLHRIVD